MAFYLKRAFGDDRDILVLNDIRLQVDDGETTDAIQINHLVIHRHGLVIVESKSVAGRIKVNAHGEWSRIWKGQESGMASPVKQAQLQADLLRKALNACAEEMRGKMLFGKIQKGFRNCPIEVLVGISDQSVIDRKHDSPEVCNADQVPDRIRDFLTRHRKAAKPLTLSLDFSADELRKIAKFLIEHHSALHLPLPIPP